MQKFLNKNKTVKLIRVDKSKNIAFLNSDDYHVHVEIEFSCSKFTRLDDDPTLSDISSFKNMIDLLRPFISDTSAHQISSNHRIKPSYGLFKRHKPEPHPLRVFIESQGTITSDIESYIIIILTKLASDIKECDGFRVKTVFV